MVGENAGTISRSFAVGDVVAGIAGGLTGGTDGHVTQSYATGRVTGSFVGGFAGVNTGVIGQAYSTGNVTPWSEDYFGGFIGFDQSDQGAIANSYWDLETSGLSDPSKGAGNIVNDPGITGLTTAQFKSSLPAGFDKKDWKEKSNVNNGYPYLIANPPQ